MNGVDFQFEWCTMILAFKEKNNCLHKHPTQSNSTHTYKGLLYIHSFWPTGKCKWHWSSLPLTLVITYLYLVNQHCCHSPHHLATIFLSPLTQKTPGPTTSPATAIICLHYIYLYPLSLHSHLPPPASPTASRTIFTQHPLITTLPNLHTLASHHDSTFYTNMHIIQNA